MLDRLDRMLLAVADAAAAAGSFERLLGARRIGERASAHLNGRAVVLALGDSDIELWAPTGDGPVATHLQRWGEGLLYAGYASPQFAVLAARLAAQGVPVVEEDGRLYLDGAANDGLPMVLSAAPSALALPRAADAACPISGFYESTHALAEGWRPVAQRHAHRFGLDASRFCPISSARWGYEGTLTLFEPAHPQRGLQRIELSQTFADKPGPMRRFVERRGGNALYMCFAEAPDLAALRERLRAAGAPYASRGADGATERDTLWVHPKHLHGMLLGVSRTGFAWTWSGQPQRVPALDS